MHKLTWGLTGIRRCQGEDRGSYSFFGEAQTKHWRNNNRQRPSGEAATLRIVQVRSPITTSPILVNGLLSTLEEIERRSRALLEKGIAARFVDKGEDSKEVARLIDRLREAITHYQVSGNYFVASDMIQTDGQVSQQQAIYDQKMKFMRGCPSWQRRACPFRTFSQALYNILWLFFFQTFLRPEFPEPNSSSHHACTH